MKCLNAIDGASIAVERSCQQIVIEKSEVLRIESIDLAKLSFSALESFCCEIGCVH